MPKIQTSCPNCNQPMVADIFQVVDIEETPQIKEILLSGGLNFAQCQACGFQGQLPVPMVYHDREKELLLTFTPPGANKTMEEKESALAPLLKHVIDNLDQKDRKGYLFQPKAMLTMNNLVKNVLIGDGITEEMIQDQQDKMKLLDELFAQEGQQLKQTAIDKNEQIDREFFVLFAEIAQRIIASRDEKSIEKIKTVQDVLMAETDIGKEILSESKEIQAATESLEALGKNLTRFSLLDLIVKAPNHERIRALAGLVRPAMDYEFFQKFTEMIEKSEEESRKELIERRNLLLKQTQEIDQQLEQRLIDAREVIEKIINSDPIEDGLMNNLASIDQFFVQALSAEINTAETNNDTDRQTKLNTVLQKIQEMTTPPEISIIEELVGLVDEEEKLDTVLESLDPEMSAKVVEYLTSLVNNYEEQAANKDADNLEQIEETLIKLKELYNILLRRSMMSNLKK